MNKEKVQIIASEIKRYHRLIQKAQGKLRDSYISQMNDLIEKREAIERKLYGTEEEVEVEEVTEEVTEETKED